MGGDTQMAPSSVPQIDTARPSTQRGSLRSKALFLGIFGSVGVRFVTLASPFITLPVALNYLGPDVFGFWMVIVSVTAVSSFVDLGLGSGLLTKLPTAFARGDLPQAQALISSAYLALTAVSLGLVVLVWSIVPNLDWPALVPGAAAASRAGLVQVALACLTAFALTIPIWLIQRVQYSYQQAWSSNVWQLFAGVATVAAVFAAVQSDAGVFATVAAATGAGPAVMLINNIAFFTAHKDLRPRIRFVSVRVAGGLIRLGAGFFAISVFTGIGLNLDTLILSRFASLEDVGFYALVTRLFNALPALIALALLPLWPANSDALARKDTAWVRRLTRLMLFVSLAAALVGGIAFVFARDLLMEVWLHSNYEISVALAIALVAWSVVFVSSSPWFSVQNSVGFLRLQFIAWPIFILLSVPVKVLLFLWWGLPGLPIGASVVYLVTLLPAGFIGYRIVLRSSEKENS